MIGARKDFYVQQVHHWEGHEGHGIEFTTKPIHLVRPDAVRSDSWGGHLGSSLNELIK